MNTIVIDKVLWAAKSAQGHFLAWGSQHDFLCYHLDYPSCAYDLGNTRWVLRQTRTEIKDDCEKWNHDCLNHYHRLTPDSAVKPCKIRVRIEEVIK